MSEVEQLYVAIQSKLGGTVPWNRLHPVQQMDFIQAVNVILQICQGVHTYSQENTFEQS